AYGTLKSALDAVSTAAEALGKSETFNGVKSSVTGDSFTATTKSGAGVIPGNYSVKVESLAQAQVLTTDGVADRKQDLVSGGKVEISFKLENAEEPHTITLDADKTSLEDIVKAINADSKLGVSATIMNAGGDNPHRLMLSANETGTESRITAISVAAAEGSSADVSTLEGLLAYDEATAPVVPPGEGDDEPPAITGMHQIVKAEDASVVINGIKVTGQTNKLEDVIDGVTLNLTKAVGADGAADTLRVTRDDTVTTTAVNNFVNAYNALQSTIKSLTSYDVDAQQGAALTGDSLARRAQSQVRDSLNGLAINGLTLASIGIKTDPTTGNLSVDST